MISYVSGDILLSKSQAIAHGIAANDDFKKGLAAGLKEYWPALYKDFRHYCHIKHPSPGEVWMWGTTDGKRVFNLFTQEGAYDHGSRPGKASIKHVHKYLKELKLQIAQEGIKSLAISKIATGVGGLSWDEVKPLIEEELSVVDTKIYVYEEYEQGLAAEAE